MSTFWQYLRFGWRMMWKAPGFTAVCLLTLAIGIGANSAIFSIVYNTLLKPLPFSKPDQLVMIWEVDPNLGITRGGASPAEFLDWREQNHVFQNLAAWRGWFYTLTGQGDPEQVWGAKASANFFRMLRVKPFLGRDFGAQENIPGHEQVVMLSYSLWQKRYGADPNLLGKSIVVDDAPYSVIGILPPGFSLFGTSREFEVWLPLAIRAGELNRNDHSVAVFARLKDGVDRRQAQSEMTTILQRLQRAYPAADQGISIRVSPMQEEPIRDMRAALLLLGAAVGFVLFIACVNVANLLLARSAAREREIAIRSALGAGRWRIVTQLLTESILLAFIGGVLGLFVAYNGLRVLRVLLPPEGGFGEMPRMEQIGIHPAVVGFTFVLSCLAGIVFGLAPALQVSRAPLNEVLKEGSRGATGGKRGRLLSSLLVVSEIGLALFLLIGAGLLIRSFSRLMNEAVGFQPQNLLTMQLWLPQSHYADGRPIVNFYGQLLDRIRALPGIRSATAANFLPMSGWYDFGDLEIEGRPTPPPGRELISSYVVVHSNYVSTIGLKLREGRTFADSDGPESPGVAMISASMARQYWPSENPVGRRVRIRLPQANTPWRPKPGDGWLRIVGVVADIRDWSWNQPASGQIYLLDSQNPARFMGLIVRTSAEPTAMTSAIRRAIAEVDPNQPVIEIHTMEQLMRSATARRRLSMLLLAIFAGFATLLSAIGIYGVMSHAVTQRNHEFGIRMALGAQPKQVVQMVLREGVLLALAGVVVGIVASAVSVPVIRSLLYGVSTFDPVTFVVVVGLIGVVTFVSCYFPARRATRVDPMAALRSE